MAVIGVEEDEPNVVNEGDSDVNEQDDGDLELEDEVIEIFMDNPDEAVERAYQINEEIIKNQVSCQFYCYSNLN